MDCSKKFIVILFQLFFVCISAQEKDTTVTEQKEALEVIKKIFNSKNNKQTDTLKEAKKKLSLVVLPGFGYLQQTGITLAISYNLSFYIGKKRTNNLSTIGSDWEYSPSHHQIILPVTVSIWNKGNKINWTADCRYLKFPNYTYGLGGKTLLSNAFLVDYSYLKIYFVPYKSILTNFYIGLGYNLDYHWNIKNKNSTSDYLEYTNSETKSTSSGISLNVKYDSRKNSNNPDRGTYFLISLRNNFTILGSNTNWTSLIIDLRKYLKIKSRSYNLLALWAYSSLVINGKAPYFDLPTNGHDAYALTGRGYISGRFKGNKFIYVETEYRFNLLRNGLLGGVLFANAETISEWPSGQFKKINPAVGTGLRVKVNKHSNVNYSIDYGIGLNGSNGFFIHLCEVF